MEEEISSEFVEGSDDVFRFGDHLELNQFDGLPYSSRYYKLLQERKKLPIWKTRIDFMNALENNQLIVVSGTTKTGKSTQVPQWCAEFCLSAEYHHGVVVCSQIQRQQAVDLALRVADEMDVNIGHEVGYSIPLENCCSNDTILREMMSNPLLEHYGVVVIDQAHERTVSTDLLLGLLREVISQRPELRVVVLSVPPASDRLVAHYGGVPHLRVEAMPSAEVVYSSGGRAESFYAALRLVLEVHRAQEPGDMAVFLASEQEVSCACSILAKEAARLSGTLGELVPLAMCPLHAGICLPITEDQKKSRRVFLSCSQSEDLFWSVDTLNFVIDTGVEKRFVTPSCFVEPPVGMVTEAMRCYMKLYHPEGDHFTLINIYNTFKSNFTPEEWCQDYFLCCAALQTAEAIRAELTDIMKQLELPMSEPAFGTKANTLNIKRALLAGFFMQIARDVDGSGSYFMLSTKHMAKLHPLSAYGAKTPQLSPPEWLLFHEYTLCDSNCIRTATPIPPQLYVLAPASASTPSGSECHSSPGSPATLHSTAAALEQSRLFQEI
uniref:Helicase ATP-binding domain-containing protein n=1 Tax=Electrophorus electricus TaxID=8005 RepID=A0A4W4HAK6_ELEEL